MLAIEKKLPRGVIYHTLRESFLYFLYSIFKNLCNEEKILLLESKFAKYCERQYCVAFPFARIAIYYVLKNLNLPNGSEVLMPPITIKGIVDVVIDLGLKPVYVETDPDTICFDITDLQKKIKLKTKVAIITPLFGLVPNLPKMMKLFRDNDIFVIEDYSQCLNGYFESKRVGTFGDVGVYSSSSIKTLDTLGGGLLVTDDPHLFYSLKEFQFQLEPPDRKFLIKKAWINSIRNIATSKFCFSLITFHALQFIRRLNPSAALKQTGNRDKNRIATLPKVWFRRYTSVQAEIGLSKLSSIHDSDAKRIANVHLIKDKCKSVKFPLSTACSKDVYWQLILIVQDSYEIQEFLALRGIDSATSSLELVCSLQGYPNSVDLPVASNIYRNGIFIPCFPQLSNFDIERIVKALTDYESR